MSQNPKPDPDYSKKLYELEQQKIRIRAKAYRDTNKLFVKIGIGLVVAFILFMTFMWIAGAGPS